MKYKTVYNTPMGIFTLASDGENLTGLWIDEQKYHGSGLCSTMQERNDIPVFEKTKEWLSQYFEGKKPRIDELQLAPEGSSFRQLVWKILCEIPYGAVITYGDIAKRIERETGKRMSGQAVGGAVGHNPISIIIPCHRVVGANGNLTGYASGINKKIRLLELEGVDMDGFFNPSL